MPFAFDPLDEEQKKKQAEEQAGADMSAPAMTGGGESFGPSTPQGQSQPPSEKGAQTQGSGFVGIDKYMRANQGNNFGNQVTGKVRDTVSQANQSLNQGANDFTSASNQSTTRWNDVGDQVKSVVDSAGDATSQDDVKKVQGVTGARYQGPDNFSGTAYGTKAHGDLRRASQQANALQSEGGRFALLDQFYGRPSYSMGQKSLDNLLVRNQPGAAGRASAIGTSAKGLAGSAAETERNLDNLAASNRFETQNASKQANDYLTGARTGFETDLNKRYQDYTSENDAYNKALRDDLSDDTFGQDTLDFLGVGDGSNLYDVDLKNYVQDTPSASLGQFANDQDYARYQALQQLAGEDPTLLSGDERGSAGTAGSMGRVTANREALQRDIAGRGQSFNGDIERIWQDNLANQRAEGISYAGANGGHVPTAQETLQNALQKRATGKSLADVERRLLSAYDSYGAGRTARRG